MKKRKNAYSVVTGAAAGGGVSGALPVPGADIAATIGIIIFHFSFYICLSLFIVICFYLFILT